MRVPSLSEAMHRELLQVAHERCIFIVCILSPDILLRLHPTLHLSSTYVFQNSRLLVHKCGGVGFGARAHSARSQLAAWKFSALGGVPAPFSSQRTIFGMELLGFTGKDKCDMMYMDMCAYICIYIYTQNMFVLGCHKRGKFEQKYDVICVFVSWATRMDKEWLALTN